MSNSIKLELNIDVEQFKEELFRAETGEDFLEAFKCNEDLFHYFSVLVKVRGLSELMNLPLDTASPLVGWPTDVKSNVYCEIIKLASIEVKEKYSAVYEKLTKSQMDSSNTQDTR